MFDEIMKSIKSSLYDRTASPLCGAFVISWLIWNYRLLFVLFSEMSTKDSFGYIDYALYSDYHTHLFRGFVWPLLSAIGFLLVYPYPARWVYHYSRWQQRKLQLIRQRLEDEVPLTVAQSRRIRREIAEMREINNKLSVDLAQETENYKRQLHEKDGVIGGLKNQLVDKPKPKAAGGAVMMRRGTDGRRILQTVSHSSEELEHLLIHGKFRLVYNPATRKSKPIRFHLGGYISEGRNENEYGWRVMHNKLELLQRDELVHNRFVYDADSQIFLSTNDKDVQSIVHGQYIIPDFEDDT